MKKTRYEQYADGIEYAGNTISKIRQITISLRLAQDLGLENAEKLERMLSEEKSKLQEEEKEKKIQRKLAEQQREVEEEEREREAERKREEERERKRQEKRERRERTLIEELVELEDRKSVV